MTIHDQRVTISGIVDLVHVPPDRFVGIDYKTDPSRRGVSEDTVQLSVYLYGLESLYSEPVVAPTLAMNGRQSNR